MSGRFGVEMVLGCAEEAEALFGRFPVTGAKSEFAAPVLLWSCLVAVLIFVCWLAGQRGLQWTTSLIQFFPN